MNLALVGAGLMGSNHARIVSECDDAKLTMVIDTDSVRAQLLAEKCSSEWGTDISQLRKTDAVILASATDTHYQLAMDLIELRLPILIEKPIACSLSQVQNLVDMASKYGVPIMCGFVERFNPVFASVKSLISSELLQINSMRQSPRNPRVTSSAVWDLLIHDIDLALQLTRLSSPPTQILGSGIYGSNPDWVEAVEAVMRTDKGPLLSHSASRLWHRKVRTMDIVDQECLLELDFLRQTITKFRHVSQEQIIDGTFVYRSDTIVDIPFVRHSGEPLALQFLHFMNLVRGNSDFRQELQGLLLAHTIAESIDRACKLN